MNRMLTVIVVFVAVFFVVFMIGYHYHYPEDDKESIFIKTGGWPTEIRHMEVEMSCNRVHPVLVLKNSFTPVEFDFEFNDWTTDINHDGFFVKPMWVDKKTITEIAVAENNKRVQRFFVGDIRVFVMYIVLLNDEVYYTIEEVCTRPGFFYGMSAENVDSMSMVVIHRHPDITAFYVILVVISGIIAAIFTASGGRLRN